MASMGLIYRLVSMSVLRLLLEDPPAIWSTQLISWNRVELVAVFLVALGFLEAYGTTQALPILQFAPFSQSLELLVAIGQAYHTSRYLQTLTFSCLAA
jgi:hypothetical protein